MYTQEQREILDKVNEDEKLENFLLMFGVGAGLTVAYVWGAPEEYNRQCNLTYEHDLEQLFAGLATYYHDGHYVIFRFTTGYKAGFGTPDIRNGTSIKKIDEAPIFDIFREALLDAILNMRDFS